MAQLVERQGGGRKVPECRFDYRICYNFFKDLQQSQRKRLIISYGMMPHVINFFTVKKTIDPRIPSWLNAAIV